jgi:glycosyltransferase involved in cell wall biosynthesis
MNDTHRELPLVSVITPSLNQGRYIEEAIRSVVEQDYPRVHQIVVDGVSTDGTIGILQEYRRRYPDRLEWVSEPDRGPTEALNKGIRRARGAIIGWLNADDFYMAGAVRKAVEAFERAPGVAIVYGRARHVWTHGEDLGAYPVRAPFDWRALADECYICQPAAFIRRSALLEARLLDERFMNGMDYELWIRMGKRYKFEFLDADLARSRLHPESGTFTRRRQLLAACIQIIKEHYGFVPLSWCCTYVEHLWHGGDQFFTPPIFNGRVKALGSLLFLRHNLARPDYVLATLLQRWKARRAHRT